MEQKIQTPSRISPNFRPLFDQLNLFGMNQLFQRGFTFESLTFC